MYVSVSTTDLYTFVSGHGLCGEEFQYSTDQGYIWCHRNAEAGAHPKCTECLLKMSEEVVSDYARIVKEFNNARNGSAK